MSTTTVAFYLLATLMTASSLGVALSHNIVYSAFALMGALLGAAGIFVLLGADLLGDSPNTLPMSCKEKDSGQR